MREQWRLIEGFENYSVSDYGRVRSEKSGRVLALSMNQFGVVCVGMMNDGTQRHRSVPLLVAQAFIPRPFDPFDTPINLDGNRWNNRVDNLAWRPRWFAIKYNQQFRDRYPFPIFAPLQDIKTGEISKNSLECAMQYGLLEKDVVLSIMNRTYVWPTYQEFRVLEE